MIAPFSTREPSLTFRKASRPGILAETAALVRATTYPLATTATDPSPPFLAAPPSPDADTVITRTGTVPPRRPIITTAAITTTAAPVSHNTRPSARLTAGGGSSRLIRSFERSAAGGEAVTPRQAQAADFATRLLRCAAPSPAPRVRSRHAVRGAPRAGCTAAVTARRPPSRPARAPASPARAARRRGGPVRCAAP